jgi:hypothetical protein
MNAMFRVIAALFALAALCQCSSTTGIKGADVVVSVKDQKLGVYRAGQLVNTYKISTSKFGLGDKPGSCCTPLGKHQIVAKIGHGLPPGAVLKSRQWNGEVLKPNAPGRDPIVSRILWLRGTESANRNAYSRFIYIHGTTEESRLGVPASYGCVRMAAKDVIRIFDGVPVGASVVITKEHLPRKELPGATEPVRPTEAPIPIQMLAAQSQPSQPVQAKPKGTASPSPVLVTKGQKGVADRTPTLTLRTKKPKEA